MTAFRMADPFRNGGPSEWQTGTENTFHDVWVRPLYTVTLDPTLQFPRWFGVRVRDK